MVGFPFRQKRCKQTFTHICSLVFAISPFGKDSFQTSLWLEAFSVRNVKGGYDEKRVEQELIPRAQPPKV